jgi:hypothetical protein
LIKGLVEEALEQEHLTEEFKMPASITRILNSIKGLTPQEKLDSMSEEDYNTIKDVEKKLLGPAFSLVINIYNSELSKDRSALEDLKPDFDKVPDMRYFRTILDIINTFPEELKDEVYEKYPMLKDSTGKTLVVIADSVMKKLPGSEWVKARALD